LHCKEIRTTIIKLTFIEFAANLATSDCDGRQNTRLRVRFDSPKAIGIASFSSPAAMGREWKLKSQSGLRTIDSDEKNVLFFFAQQYDVIPTGGSQLRN
jgi:hypothetical protein